MKTRTKQILDLMNVLTWVLFIACCVKAGTILFSFLVSVIINPEATKKLMEGLDFSGLAAFSRVQYSIFVLLMVGLWAMRAFIFYLLIKIYKKINFTNPFSQSISVMISGISYLALTIGLFTLLARHYSDWFTAEGVVFPALESYLSGGAEFMFMGGVIFMIAQIYKRGIEIQDEHDLTV